MNLYKYASPTMFYPVAGKMIPWFAIPAAILFAAGMYVGFFVAPTDFQQGDAYRIIFIHVPAAWMGMFLYVVMAIYAGIGWAFNARLSSMMASAIAITGAMFTLLSLVTGALWGKPTWGTRDQTLALSKASAAAGTKLVSLTFPRNQIERYGPIAIIHSRYEARLDGPRGANTMKGQITEVFRWDGRRWLHSSWHMDFD